MNDDGLFAAKGSENIVCDSRYVAMKFEKEHKNVLQSIENLLSTPDGLSVEFGRLNFQPSSFKNAQNKKQPCYNLTRDGFAARRLHGQ
jgi:Rha family phage regulatory protein